MQDDRIGWASGLQRVLETLFSEPEMERAKLIRDFDIDTGTLDGWMHGRDIPQAYRHDLAMRYGVVSSFFESCFADEQRSLRGAGLIGGRDGEVDNYYGEIGLRCRGGSNAAWFPISREDLRMTGDPHSGASALRCLGGSSLIVIHDNVREMMFLPGAGPKAGPDHIRSVFDPAGGLAQEIFVAAALFESRLEELGRRDAFRPEATGNRTSQKFADYMSRHIHALGGEDAVLNFIRTVEIRFVDGESLTFSVDAQDASLRRLFSFVLNEGDLPDKVLIGENPARLFPAHEIAWIRIPCFHTAGYVEIGA